MRAKLGSRFEVGKLDDPDVYEVASLDGPMAPKYPVALRIVKASERKLAEWRRSAERYGVDPAQYRAAMSEALFSVPAGWLELPFVRPVTGRSAA